MRKRIPKTEYEFVMSYMDKFQKDNNLHFSEMKSPTIQIKILLSEWENLGNQLETNSNNNFRKYMSEWRKKKEKEENKNKALEYNILEERLNNSEKEKYRLQEELEKLRLQLENDKREKIIDFSNNFFKNYEEEINNTKIIHFMKGFGRGIYPDKLLRGESDLNLEQLKDLFINFKEFWGEYGLILDTGMKFKDQESLESIETDIYASIFNNPNLNLSTSDIQKIEFEKELSEREDKMSTDDWKKKILTTGISEEELKRMVISCQKSMDNLIDEDTAILHIKSEMKLTPD